MGNAVCEGQGACFGLAVRNHNEWKRQSVPPIPDKLPAHFRPAAPDQMAWSRTER